MRIVLLPLMLGATLSGCGYKGDLMMPEQQDEKAGQVDPKPIPADETD